MSQTHVTKRTGPTVVPMMALAIGMLATSTGCQCVSDATHAIPASRLEPGLFGCPREEMAPLPYAALGQIKPDEHIIGGGDTLAVYVYGIFPPTEDETPIVNQVQQVNQRYYPPHGSNVGPGTGLPIRVEADGTIDLPLVGKINVNGLNVPGAIERIKEAYRAEDVIQEGRERVTLQLLIPRVTRVVVLREDTPTPTVTVNNPQTNDTIHRGSGEVIDLPVFENDVLHALAATGGLPGTDAARELYVIRRTAGLDYHFLSAGNLQSIVTGGEAGDCNASVIRIPLAGCPCQAIPFAPQDVVLNEGDVVFVPRRNETFVTGGLLPGARIPLPRDEDIDVIEAIAMASGSAGGPLGQPGSVLAGGTPGYILEPTRVLILRKLPDGRQMNIRVDLDRAMSDPKERILIRPDDVVMLQQKPHKSVINVTMNWLGGQWIPQSFFLGGE
ncbi:MAG: polysaccharide biosynthesis/export family protein [Planctomycetota bacterium]